MRHYHSSGTISASMASCTLVSGHLPPLCDWLLCAKESTQICPLECTHAAWKFSSVFLDSQLLLQPFRGPSSRWGGLASSRAFIDLYHPKDLALGADTCRLVATSAPLWSWTPTRRHFVPWQTFPSKASYWLQGKTSPWTSCLIHA